MKKQERPREDVPWSNLWKEGIKLTHSELRLLSYLLSIDRGEKYGVRVSVPEVQTATGISRGTLHVAKRELERKGLIRILGRRNVENVNGYDLTPIKRKLYPADGKKG